MIKTIRDYNLHNKKVIIRCDFNVPIDNGKIVDNNRIIESLETIKYAIGKKAKVILMSHLGKIKSEEDKKNKSLEIVSKELSKLLQIDVKFVNQTRGSILETVIEQMKSGEVVLVENTRFEDYPNKLESSNDADLGKYWASLGDIFINDAFGTSHRAHASNVGIATFLPSGIGFLIEKELSNLSVLKKPKRPFVVILGGGKISDKIDVVSYLSTIADKILIGGGMVYTFLKAQGYNIGKSLCDDDSIKFAQEMLIKNKDKIILSVDSVCAKEMIDTDVIEITSNNNIKDSDIGLDIGPKTIELFNKELKKAKTIFWNGTLGYSEFKHFSNGTREILKTVTNNNGIVILGGGDTVAASSVFGFKDKVTFASTGGGATLDYIAQKKLPGIEVIQGKE